MRLVDYDTEQYQDYARGRALTEQQLRAWISAFTAVLPERRPLVGLDVGSGTGRFTPRWRERSGRSPASSRRSGCARSRRRSPSIPDVRYLAGSAEDLPVPSGSVDYALMFLSWHHVQDKPRAARELARVLRPGGRLLLRGNFSDHHPRPWWLDHFPRGYEVDAALFQPLHEVIAMFTADGWRVASFGMVTEPPPGTRGDMLERLRLRTLSFFAQLSPDEAGGRLPPLRGGRIRDPDAPSPVLSEPLLTLERR